MDRTKWNDDQAKRMEILERVKQPTEWQFGELNLLRRSTYQPGESRRAEDLAAKWAKKREKKSQDDATADLLGGAR